MEILVGIIAALGAAIYFLFNKLKQTEADSKLANTKGQDQQLVTKIIDLQAAIKEIDEALAKTKKPVEDTNLTDQQKADKWNKE